MHLALLASLTIFRKFKHTCENNKVHTFLPCSGIQIKRDEQLFYEKLRPFGKVHIQTVFSTTQQPSPLGSAHNIQRRRRGFDRRKPNDERRTS